MDEIKILEARMAIVDRLNTAFRIERYVHITLSVLSFVIVCVSGWSLYSKGLLSNGQLLAFLGPTGFLAVAVTRILYMWSASLKIIMTGKWD